MAEINATESAQKLAEEMGVDLSVVSGSGVNGRILKKDVEDVVAAQEELEDAPEEPEDAPEEPEDAPEEPEDDPAVVAGRAVGEGVVRGIRTEGIDRRTPVWIRLINARQAVVSGQNMLQGEARRVPYYQYQTLKQRYPGFFGVQYPGTNEYVVE